MPRSFLIKKRDALMPGVSIFEAGVQSGICLHDHIKEEAGDSRDISPGESSEEENREPEETLQEDTEKEQPAKRRKYETPTRLPESATTLLDKIPKVPKICGGGGNVDSVRHSPAEASKIQDQFPWQNHMFPFFPPHYPYFPMNFPLPGYPVAPLIDKHPVRTFPDYSTFNGSLPFFPPNHFLRGSPMGYLPPTDKLSKIDRVVDKVSESAFDKVFSKFTEPSEPASLDLSDKKKFRDDVPRYMCDGCNKSYSTYSGLCKHKQFHCALNAKKEFSCKYCDKTYVSLGALKMHIRTHTLPCKCKLCGKAFSRPWLLQGHLRTHTGEKPYRCEQCGRAFADRSNLRAHLQTHSEVKKYSCKSCSKTFSRMSLLLKHEDNCLVIVR